MATIDAPDTAAPARRRRLIAAAVVAVLALAGAIAYDALVLSYEPIRLGGFFGPTDGEPVAIEAPAYKGALQWDFEAGETFGYSFAIENGGDRAVRIVDVPDGTPPAYWERARVQVSELFTDEHCCVAEDLRDFEPFTMQPGDLRQLVITYRFRDCTLDAPSAWATLSWDRHELDYRFWGVTRSMSLELPFVAAVRAGGECTPGS